MKHILFLLIMFAVSFSDTLDLVRHSEVTRGEYTYDSSLNITGTKPNLGLIYERILIEDSTFTYLKWDLFSSKNDTTGYLGADGLMPSIRVSGIVRREKHTLQFRATKKRYDHYKKYRDFTLECYKAEHGFELFWFDPHSKSYFLQKNYQRKVPKQKGPTTGAGPNKKIRFKDIIIESKASAE